MAFLSGDKVAIICIASANSASDGVAISNGDPVPSRSQDGLAESAPAMRKSVAALMFFVLPTSIAQRVGCESGFSVAVLVALHKSAALISRFSLNHFNRAASVSSLGVFVIVLITPIPLAML